jgi:hypothetical protein
MNETESAFDVSKKISIMCLPARLNIEICELDWAFAFQDDNKFTVPQGFRGTSRSSNSLRPSNSLFVVHLLILPGSSRFPYHENSSSDSEEEILRRLKLQQSISLQSGQIAKYGGFSQSINVDGFQPVPTTDISTKPIKHSSSRTSSLYNNGHRYSNTSNHRDLLGQAERGKIGSHSSSECSSNSSVEASVESNMGLINHEKKGKRIGYAVKACASSLTLQSSFQIEDKLIRSLTEPRR